MHCLHLPPESRSLHDEYVHTLVVQILNLNAAISERHTLVSSIFSSPTLWSAHHGYVTAQAVFQHHHVDLAQLDLGTSCLVTVSSSLYQRLLALVSTE